MLQKISWVAGFVCYILGVMIAAPLMLASAMVNPMIGAQFLYTVQGRLEELIARGQRLMKETIE